MTDLKNTAVIGAGEVVTSASEAVSKSFSAISALAGMLKEGFTAGEHVSGAGEVRARGFKRKHELIAQKHEMTYLRELEKEVMALSMSDEEPAID